MIKKKGITKLTAQLKDSTNDTDDSISEEEHIRTDSTGTIHTELKIVEEEEEYDFRTDTDEEENEKSLMKILMKMMALTKTFIASIRYLLSCKKKTCAPYKTNQALQAVGFCYTVNGICILK